MKKRDLFLFIGLFFTAFIFVFFSSKMREGAFQGLALAQNTIIPSLLPLLIIFMTVMRSGAKDIMSKLFGKICVYLFNLPPVTFPALLFGMIGGYPTGAVLTMELFENGDIDRSQAKRLMRFNVCGGCGFIITALGNSVLNDGKIGAVLFASNVTANLLMGFLQSFKSERIKMEYYSFCRYDNISDGFNDAVNSSVMSVMNISALVVLFGAFNEIAQPPKALLPILEITNGLCGSNSFTIPQISAYLAFSGLCIHLQIIPVLAKIKMSYGDFLISRIIASGLSYVISKIILDFFPVQRAVFSNSSENVAVFSSVNIALSFLMIFGCFVLVCDLSSRKKRC